MQEYIPAIISLAVSIATFYLIAKFIIHIFRRTGAPMYCTSCGHEGPTAIRARGSILIEIILWFCFIVPGLIYSLWRGGSRRKVCKQCGSTSVIPPTSPVALESKRRLGL